MTQKLKRCPPGSRKDTKRQNRCFTKTGEELFRKGELKDPKNNIEFMFLAYQHIMQTPLENVITKLWLKKDDCNIFLIGETHGVRNHKCVGTYDMFKKMLTDFIDKKINSIDIMLEIKEEHTKNYTMSPFNKMRHTKYIDRHTQMINVRRILSKCIATKKCPFKVHWADSNGTTNSRFPKWIKLLSEGKDRNTLKNASIIQDKELFTPESMMKLLTEHGIVTKEVEKAQKVEPRFTLDFAKSMFAHFIDEYKNYTIDKLIFHLLRRAIDIYTAARIIAKQMKNVIVYEGDNHVRALRYIFSFLGFTTEKIVNDVICL